MEPRAIQADEIWEAAMDAWDTARKTWLHADQKHDAQARIAWEEAKRAKTQADVVRFGK